MCDTNCLILLMICFLIVEGNEITTAKTLNGKILYLYFIVRSVFH